jgi:hypothetical protein
MISIAVAGDTATDKIPNSIIEAAVKRAKTATGCQQQFSTDPSAQWSNPGVIIIFQEEGKGKGETYANTPVAHPTGAPAYTQKIQIWPETFWEKLPGSREDPLYMENLLFLALCHEMEHMPETPGGNVPPHPGPQPGADNSQANKCTTIAQYQRDGDRACQQASAAAANLTYTGAERCKRVRQACRWHKKVQELANTPLLLQGNSNCSSLPHPPSSNHNVHNCPSCDGAEGDCPNSAHRFE